MDTKANYDYQDQRDIFKLLFQAGRNPNDISTFKWAVQTVNLGAIREVAKYMEKEPAIDEIDERKRTVKHRRARIQWIRNQWTRNQWARNQWARNQTATAENQTQQILNEIRNGRADRKNILGKKNISRV